MDSLIPSLSIFLLIFMRISAFFVIMPIFSYRTLPASYRIGFAAFLAFLVQYTVQVEPIEINALYFFLIIKEALVGLFIGFLAYMMLSAIQIAGGFIDFQMGFAIANVIDPQTGAQSPIIGQYLYMFSILFLLSINGHHMIIRGIMSSYQLIPIEQLMLSFSNENLALFVIKAFSFMFLIAFQMAVPIVASIFLVDVALGILARTVPQLNVFVVGFPIKIGVSFILLFIAMGFMFIAIQNLFEKLLIVMSDVMKLLGEIG